MDFKKVLDQTVRELKREVNKKVLKVPEIEQKVLDATSNEPWGPHGTAMAEIAHATRNHFEYQMIMTIIWKRLSDTGRNWRHVYKALTLLEYLVAHGSERVIDDIREHGYQISALNDFQHLDPNGRDQGINVRKKSQTIMSLVNDKEKIKEARQKAVENRDKYRGVSSTGGIYKPSTYQSSAGGYGDRYREDGYGGATRYGGRDDYGYRDGDHYRDDDKEKDWEKDQNGRGGDRYRGGYDDKGYDREMDRHDAKRGDGQRNDQYDRAYDDDGRHSRRSVGDRDSGFEQDERTAAPPSYEESYKSHEPVVAKNGDQTTVAARALNSNTNQLIEDLTSTKKSFFDDDDDEFDPRANTAVLSQNDNIFSKPASSGAVRPLAPPPVPSISVGNTAGVFGVLSAQATTISRPLDGNFFEGSPFKVEAPAPAPTFSGIPSNAFPADFSSDNNFGTYTSSVPPPHVSIQSTDIPYSATIPSAKNIYGGSDNLDIFSAMPTVTQTQAAATPVSEDLFGVPFNSATATSSVPSLGISSTNMLAQQDSISNVFHVSQGQSSGFTNAAIGASTKLHPEKKFQTKSTVWADSLSKGLIDLNISAPKSNPLGDLGIDFDLLRTERKKEERVSTNKASSTGMGKAMGSGSGLGVAGASVLVRPQVPLTVNNMVMTPNININQMGMGMGMGMQQAPMQMGLNPGMATRPVSMGPAGMGIGGLPNQQQYGGYM